MRSGIRQADNRRRIVAGMDQGVAIFPHNVDCVPDVLGNGASPPKSGHGVNQIAGDNPRFGVVG